MKKLFFIPTFFLLFQSLFAQDPHQLFYGHWIKKAYIDNLIAKKSAYQMQEYTGNITEIIFTKALGDSVLISFQNSEGGKYPVFFTSDNEAFIELSKTENFTLVIEKAEKKAREMTYKNSEGGEEKFLFLNGEDTDFNGIHRWVNKNLLSGGYATSIEMGMRLRGIQDASVWFNMDGTVIGIPGFDKYEILTHFDDISDFDMIKLINSQTNKTQWKGWEMKTNRLVLYNLEKGEDYQYKKGTIYKQLERKQ